MADGALPLACAPGPVGVGEPAAPVDPVLGAPPGAMGVRGPDPAEDVPGGQRSGPHHADDRCTEAATLWTEVAALIAKAGETGDAQSPARTGAVLCDLARIEREAMRALNRLSSEAPRVTRS